MVSSEIWEAFAARVEAERGAESLAFILPALPGAQRIPLTMSPQRGSHPMRGCRLGSKRLAGHDRTVSDPSGPAPAQAGV